MLDTTESIIHLRRGLIAHGYRVVPCAGKRAQGLNWPNSKWRDDQMAGLMRHLPHATNTGILTGDVVAIDVDTPDEKVARDINAMVAEIPHFDAAPYRIGRAPKRCVIFRANTPRSKVATGAYLIDGHKCELEVLGVGNQVVAYGTHPDTGRHYEWFNGSPAETALTDLPEITPAAIDELLARAGAYFAERGECIKRSSKSAANDNEPRAVVEGDHPWSLLNQRALVNLGAWVPELGLDGLRRYQAGYHSVASFRPSINAKVKHRGRSLNIQPAGIVDYSDSNRGYSPIDLVSVCLNHSPSEAVEWLRGLVGEDERPRININYQSIIATGVARAAQRSH
jgi:hypothetical protein